MNTVTKVVLIGGGLAAFYALRKYADKKFAVEPGSEAQAQAQSSTASVIDTIKKMLPADIIPEQPSPAVTAPAPSTTPDPVQTSDVEPTVSAPIIETPTIEPSEPIDLTKLIKPPMTYPVNTYPATSYPKTYTLHPKTTFSIAGLNLRS